MAVSIHPATLTEFDHIIHLSENADKTFEWIGGAIVEVLSTPYASSIASTIGFYLSHHMRHNKIRGHVTGENGGYQIAPEYYVPNVAYISAERQPQLAREGYNPNPPELAVEVLSPSDQDNPRHMRIKISNYLAVGTTVWVVDPEQQIVEVYLPGQAVSVVDIQGTLDGGNILPGFKLAVKDIFPGESTSPS